MIATKINHSRIAGPNELYSTNWVQSQLIGAQTLSRGTRGYLWFCLALVKRGYETIAATQREIADSYYRATGGNRSIRSLQYALNELEENGFVRRSKYRVGSDHFRSVIVINKDAFAFWTRERSKNVTPIPTPVYNSSYAQKMPKDTGREITPCNNLLSSDSEYKEPRAHMRSKSNAKQFKFHPIIFSLLTVLKWPKFEPVEIQLAKAELSGLVDRTEIRWSKWERDWQRLPIDEREGICRTSFLPRLRDHSAGGLTIPKPRTKAAVTPIRKPEPAKPPEPFVPATRDFVSSLLSAAAFYKRPETEPDKPPAKISETDLKLLSETRKATEDRRKRIV